MSRIHEIEYTQIGETENYTILLLENVCFYYVILISFNFHLIILFYQDVRGKINIKRQSYTAHKMDSYRRKLYMLKIYVEGNCGVIEKVICEAVTEII